MNLLPSQEKVWEKYYPDSAKNFTFPRMNIYDLVYEENRGRKDAIALEYEGNEICFGEYFDKVDERTEYLKNLGVKKDDVVTISMLMSPEFVYDWYALGRLNAVSNLIDPRTSIEGISQYINEADSKYILNTDIFTSKVLKSIGDDSDKAVINFSLSDYSKHMPFDLGLVSMLTGAQSKLLSLKDKRLILSGAKKILENTSNFETEYIPDQPLTIVHTGGTTGFPKGVVLSHDNYNAMAYEYMKSQIGFAPYDRFLLVMPPWISYGSGMLHMSMVTGMKSTIISKLDSKKMDQYLIKHKPQWFAGVPAHYRIVSDSQLIREKGVDFLKAGAVGGDSMTAELYEKANNFLVDNGAKQGVYPGYALTEVTSAFAVKQLGTYKPGSVGIPLPGCTVGIFKFDEEKCITLDEELGYNQKGEICMKTPNQMLGYFKNDELTSTVLKKHKDGEVWVHTGDLGHIDEDGFLYVDGRIKEMIIRHDGFKVYPNLIENIINSYEAVQSCKVVGINDIINKQGAVPKAYIVLKEQYLDNEQQILKEIKNMCCQKLPEYYTENMEFETIEKLPLTPIGKVDFKALQEKGNSRVRK